MSFFTRLFGSREENSNLTLRQIAEALHIQNPRITFNGEEVGTLEAGWNGASLYLRYKEGRVLRCTLSHASLPHGFDLEYDREKRKRPVFPLPTGAIEGGDEADFGGTVHVGGGILCERQKLRNFGRLPETLRSRLIAELGDARISYFRPRTQEVDITFRDDDETTVDKAHIVRALAAAMEVCKARGLDESTGATMSAKESRVYSPLSVAKEFARAVPGAKVEDLGGMGPRGIWARVTFEHEGQTYRLVFYRFDAVTCGVWLETRAVGKLGAFGLMYDDPTASSSEDDDDANDGDDDDDDDANDDGHAENGSSPGARIFLNAECYVDGEYASSEAARVLSLSEDARELLFALVSELGTAAVLREEVLSLNLNELTAFVDARDAQPRGVTYPLELASRLAALARALPVQSREVVALAEHRTCRFCSTAYVFSPTSPACVRCGAPPEAGPDGP